MQMGPQGRQPFWGDWGMGYDTRRDMEKPPACELQVHQGLGLSWKSRRWGWVT